MRKSIAKEWDGDIKQKEKSAWKAGGEGKLSYRWAECWNELEELTSASGNSLAGSWIEKSAELVTQCNLVVKAAKKKNSPELTKTTKAAWDAAIEYGNDLREKLMRA